MKISPLLSGVLSLYVCVVREPSSQASLQHEIDRTDRFFPVLCERVFSFVLLLKNPYIEDSNIAVKPLDRVHGAYKGHIVAEGSACDADRFNLSSYKRAQVTLGPGMVLLLLHS